MALRRCWNGYVTIHNSIAICNLQNRVYADKQTHVITIKNQFGDVKYRQISNFRRSLIGNKIVDHSDVVGASPVGAVPTTAAFSTQHMDSIDCADTAARPNEKHLSLGIWCF